MKKLVVFLFLSANAYGQCEVDTISIIQSYLKSNNYIFPQQDISMNGHQAFVKQSGIFVGGSLGIYNAGTYNADYHILRRQNINYLMCSVSGYYLYGNKQIGLNISHKYFLWTYSFHIN